MRTPALSFYSALATLAGPAIRAWLALRCARGKEDRDRLGERTGNPGAPRPTGPLVWVHGASVGESMSVLALIRHLVRDRPGLSVLVTTGTVTSARLMGERLPEHALHQYAPLDHPGWAARFLDHWRPDLAIWVESELWPNLIAAAGQRGIPRLLLNGRMSAASARGWARVPRSIAALLGGFELILAQDPGQAERFAALGGGDVRTVGNLKAAAAPLPVDAGALAALRAELGDRPLWLAASTHRGEEEVVAAAHRRLTAAHPGLLTLLAPRHPTRGDDLAEALSGAGLRVARRALGQPVAPDTDVYLADTLGELGLLYSLADIAFVGGSLVPAGGHNPIEPAQLDCAVLAGPGMDNFAGVAAELRAAGGLGEVRDADSLAAAVDGLLRDPARLAERRGAARAVAEAGGGVLDAVLREIAPWLDRVAPRRPAEAALRDPARARA